MTTWAAGKFNRAGQSFVVAPALVEALTSVPWAIAKIELDNGTRRINQAWPWTLEDDQALYLFCRQVDHDKTVAMYGDRFHDTGEWHNTLERYETGSGVRVAGYLGELDHGLYPVIDAWISNRLSDREEIKPKERT